MLVLIFDAHNEYLRCVVSRGALHKFFERGPLNTGGNSLAYPNGVSISFDNSDVREVVITVSVCNALYGFA
jgi:hypothetical protein